MGALAGQRGDEAAIDLHVVKIETLQIRQRRISGAEVVQRDGDAMLPKQVQAGGSLVEAVDKHRLGQLDDQLARVDVVLAQLAHHIRSQRCQRRIPRRDVDRERDRVGTFVPQARHQFQGLLKHKAVEELDGVGLFGHRHELVGRHLSELR